MPKTFISGVHIDRMHPFRAGWTDEVLNMARHGPDRPSPHPAPPSSFTRTCISSGAPTAENLKDFS
jgi:hypothetical protein